MLIKLTTALLITSALALPQSEHIKLDTRDGDGGINGGWFGENDGKGAAVQAAPVFMFKRDNSGAWGTNPTPCYPEGAGNSKGNGPNPGTGPTLDGSNCRNPGKYSGPFSKGEPFPAYFSTVWCGKIGEWRINYSLYFSHDTTHKHDWESATMTFSEKQKGSNTWYRDTLILSQHTGHAKKKYSEVESVNMVPGDMDVRPIDGRNKNHPKVYVGAWKNPMYFDGTVVQGDRLKAIQQGDKYEPKGDDWWYLPVEGDIVKSGTLDAYKGKYGDATSDPASIRDKICGY
ncbi:MAG: hypothetical protein M1836_001030 [Candelina mexicana]|nr:MAG: hypothetical protein M1836_001030 [Candelina mexicana]